MHSPTAIKRMNAAIEYAATGDLKKVKNYIDKNKVAINTYIEMVKQASLNEQVDILKYLFTIEDLVDNLMVNRNFPSLFATACYNNQIKTVKFFAPIIGEKEIIGSMCNAARMGHKNVLEYLLTSDDISPKVHVDKTKALATACEHNKIGIVRYLLTQMGANIHVNEDEPLKAACSKNRKAIVKYLLTSKKLNDHADINTTDDCILTTIVSEMHHDLVQYVLASPELKKHANIKMDTIETACYVQDNHKMLGILLDHIESNPQSYSETTNVDTVTFARALDKILFMIMERNSMELATYFVIERNTQYSDIVKRQLQSCQNLNTNGNDPNFSQFAAQVQQLFENRELKKQLEQDLPINEIKQKRVKI